MLNDFYLHLMDWSSLNHVAVRRIIWMSNCWWKVFLGCLGSGGLYLECCWRKYCPALPKGGGGGVCHLGLLDRSGGWCETFSGDLSFAFLKQGNVLGVGNSDGTVQLWDVASSKLIRSMAGHTDRVRHINLFHNVCLMGNLRWVAWTGISIC